MLISTDNLMIFEYKNLLLNKRYDAISEKHWLQRNAKKHKMAINVMTAATLCKWEYHTELEDIHS